MDSGVPNRHNKRYIGIQIRMILARYNLSAPNSEPLKVSLPGILMLSALGVSVLCAAAVFLFLLAGEQHASEPASNGSTVSSTATPTRPTGETNARRRDSALAARDSKVAPTEFEKTAFSLVKSRSYRTAGPVRIRLLKTKRNETCDIAVLVRNRRTKRLGATVGTVIDIPMSGSLPHATVVVTGIESNRIWGYLMAPKSASSSSANVSPAGRTSRRGT